MRTGPVYSDKTDVKILILSLLTAISDPLDYDSLQDVICRDEVAGAFDFAECFAELEELGHVEHDEIDGVRYYQATATGRAVAAELQGTIPESIRRRHALEAAKIIAGRLHGSRAACEIKEEGPYAYTVICTAEDNNGRLLRLEIRVTDRSQAQKIKEHYLERPSSCLRGILSVLAGDVDYLLS